jgi:hypothetical protein
MVGDAMYFVAWYTLPFFRELNLFFINLNFVFILAPKRYGDPATGACQLLANQRGCGRAFLPWGRRRAGGRGRRCLEDHGCITEASDYFHISIFLSFNF